MRTKIPFSTKQETDYQWFRTFTSIEKWIDRLIEVKEGDDPYYLHIDHLQIVPTPILRKGRDLAGYDVFVVYHRIYLEKGE